MLLEFTNGNWLSIYGGLWPAASLPALEIRTMARDRPEGVELPDDVPNPSTTHFPFTQNSFVPGLPCVFVHPRSYFVNGDLDAQ